MLLRAVALTCLLLAATGCSEATPSLEQRKERIRAIEGAATGAALARKARSDARLAAEQVPVNPHLPVIEDDRQGSRRDSETVAWRAMALLVVALKGEGLDQATVDEIIKDYRLGPHFTPDEARFITTAAPTDHDRIQFSWRYEAAWALLWSLGYVDALGKPTDTCDVPRAVGFLRDRSAQQFLADAKLRPLDTILDEADLIYRYHWAVRDAEINNRPVPAGLSSSVIIERHYALNWLIGYMDQPWDDITTDT
jgi:hypothetical protein